MDANYRSKLFTKDLSEIERSKVELMFKKGEFWKHFAYHILIYALVGPCALIMIAVIDGCRYVGNIKVAKLRTMNVLELTLAAATLVTCIVLKVWTMTASEQLESLTGV